MPCSGTCRPITSRPEPSKLSRSKRFLSALSLAITCISLSAAAHAQDALGVGGGVWFDSATRTQRTRIGPLAATDRQDVSNVYRGAVQLSFLHAFDERPLEGFRLGADIRYLGFYATSPRDDDRTDGIGRMVDVGFRGEWSTAIATNVAFSAGLRAAAGMVFPDEDFATTIDRLRAEGVPTSTGPRPTVHIAPMVGLRWAILERIHLRLDLGFGFTMTSLFDVAANVQGLPYARVETVTGTRFDATISVEFPLP